MKKLTTLTILFFAAITTGNAQFQKGQKLLGGSINFSGGTTDAEQTSNFKSDRSGFSINPSFAWFTSSNRTTGFSLGYTRNSSFQENLIGRSYQKNVSKTMNADVFTERFYPVTNKVYFTLQARLGANYSRGTTINSGPNNEIENRQRGFGAAAGLTPGFTYQLSRRFLFDLKLANVVSAMYTRNTLSNVKPGTNPGKSVEQNFALSSSLASSTLGNVGVGFRWIIK